MNRFALHCSRFAESALHSRRDRPDRRAFGARVHCQAAEGDLFDSGRRRRGLRRRSAEALRRLGGFLLGVARGQRDEGEREREQRRAWWRAQHALQFGYYGPGPYRGGW